VLPVTDAIARIILAMGSAVEISDQAAKEGVWESAARRAREGEERADQSRRKSTASPSSDAGTEERKRMAPAATSTLRSIKRDTPFAWEGKDKRGGARVKGQEPRAR